MASDDRPSARASGQTLADGEPAHGVEPPDLGDRYVIEQEIGRGAMGVVFAARDRKLGRRVAIKVLAAGGRDPSALRRFEREAKAAGSLQHPNILIVHDIGTDGPKPYIVSELLEGTTLRTLLAGGPLRQELALRLATQLAEGLATAHAHGVVHRDLKPENLFVTRGDQLKILDFGVAKLMPESESPPDSGTRAGAIIGTIGYMAPEQVRGLAADPRSDVFSFGAILHEMLTGRTPFRGASPVEVAHAILNDDPEPPPSTVTEGPRGLVRRCLQKDPARRFASAAELVGPLRAAAEGVDSNAGRPAVRRPPSPARRVGTWGALALIAFLAAGVVANEVLRSPSGRPPPSLAVLPFTDLSAARDQEFLADGIAEEILSVLARVDGLRVAGRHSSFLLRGKDTGLEEIRAKLGVDSVLEGSVRRSGDRIRVTVRLVNVDDGYPIWSDTYERSLGDIFAVQDDIAAAVAASLRVKLVDPHGAERRSTGHPEAYAEFLRGRHFESKLTPADLQRAVDAYQRAIQLDPKFARAYAGLSSALRTATGIGGDDTSDTPYDWDPARAAAERAIAVAPDEPHGYVARAELRFRADLDWAGAQADLERALKLDPHAPDARGTYALLLGTLGRLEAATEVAKAALEEDPLSSREAIILADYYSAAGRYADARAVLVRALEVAPENLRARRQLCFVRVLEGHPAEALELCRDTIWWVRETVRAVANHSLGREPESAASLKALLPQKSLTYQLAQVHAWRGEVDQAFERLEEARARRDPGLASVKYDPLLRSLRTDPRYRPYLRSLQLPLD